MRMKQIIKGFLPAIVAIAAMVLGCTGPTPKRMSDTPYCEVMVTVEKMMCNQACPPKVKRALGSVRGVRAVDVIYNERVAYVRGSGHLCSEAGKNELVPALEKQGFGGTVRQMKMDAGG